MTLSDELSAFDRHIAEPWYAECVSQMGLPATDEEIRSLRDGLGNLTLPSEVEELYRWHNGAAVDVVMGLDFLPIERMLSNRSRAFAYGDAPLWIPVFENIWGGRYAIEAGIAGFERDPSIWVKGKDTGPEFVFASLEALFATVNEVLSRRLVSVEHLASGRIHLRGDSDLVEEVRRDHNPTPPGSPHRSFFPAVDWPASWLKSCGVDREAIVANGRGVVPIGRLIADARSSPVTATVRGRRGRTNMPHGLLQLSVEDDSGAIYVEIDQALCALEYPGVEVELDVVSGPDIRPRLESRGYPPDFARGTAIRYVEG